MTYMVKVIYIQLIWLKAVKMVKVVKANKGNHKTVNNSRESYGETTNHKINYIDNYNKVTSLSFF